LIPGFMIQGGDPTGTGRGGESYWGTPFRDEYDLKGAEKHGERGMLSMANKGASTNGSQFFVTFKATPHLNGKHTVFGKLVGGEDVLTAIEAVPVKPGTDKPAKPIKITEIVIYQDPFEDYKKRIAKKQAAAVDAAMPPRKDKGRTSDDVNWFGEKVGRATSSDTNIPTTSGGVGKYLTGALVAKRPIAVISDGLVSGEDPGVKKKKKLGFGDFESW